MTNIFNYSFYSANTRARGTDPLTSYEAAEAIAPRVSEIKSWVLATLGAPESIRRGGWTDYELEELFGDHSSTVRTRRAELTSMKLVCNSGQLRKIKGRNRIVWKLREFDCAETVF